MTSELAVSEQSEIRPIPGRFVPGVSANPGGRPKGLVRLIRERTGDGTKLITALVDVFEGRTPEGFPEGYKLTPGDWWTAVKELTDRGWGKAPMLVEVTDSSGPVGDPRWVGWTTEEMLAWRDERRARAQAVPVEGHVVPQEE